MVYRTRLASFALLLLAVALSPVIGVAQELVVEEARVALLHDINIPAQEAGVIARLDLQEGMRVTRGQVLGQIDDTVAQAEFEAARLQQLVAEIQTRNDVNLRFAEKSSEVAQADVLRANKAIATFEKSISKTEVDQLRLVAERSLLAREQAELELQAARLTSQFRAQEVTVAQQRLANRRITAPFDGIIVERHRHVGEWVQPGDTIGRLIQNDRLRVEAFVDGYRYGESLVGKSVAFTSRVPSSEKPGEWTGTVTFVNPVMNPVTGEVLLVAEVENPDRALRAGMIGTLRISP